MAKKTPKIKTVKRPAILSSDFRAGHYMKIGLNSDEFYVGFANRLYSHLSGFIKVGGTLDADSVKALTLNLTWYLEDLVSGGFVWKAFVSFCRKKYGRDLPFFQTPGSDGYLFSVDWPSESGIRFIVWYTLQSKVSDTFINPDNDFVYLITLTLTSLLYDAYEEAPDTLSRPALLPEEKMGLSILFQVRNICTWLCTGCYLTRVHNLDELTDKLNSINEFQDFDESRKEYLVVSYLPFNAKIGPVAAYAYEWLAEMIAIDDTQPDYEYLEIIRNIKSEPYSVYRYKELRKDGATILSLDGTEKEMSALSLQGGVMPSELKVGESCFMSIVYFDGKWLLNGLAYQSLAEKVYDDFREKWLKETAIQEMAYQQTLKSFKNKRIGVCRDYSAYLDMFPTINRNSEEKLPEDFKDCENLVYFLNSDSEVSLLINWGYCIKLRGNKFYDKRDAEEEASHLILDHKLATPEFRNWLIDHNLIPDAALNSIISVKAGKKLFQDNIRFINDFMSRDSMDIYSPDAYKAVTI